MTPEGKVKDKIKQVLERIGAYYHMPVTNGMGKSSVDFICCIHGKFVAIEAKADGGHLTLRQQLVMKEMQAAGAVAVVVKGVEEAKMLQTTLGLLEVV